MRPASPRAGIPVLVTLLYLVFSPASVGAEGAVAGVILPLSGTHAAFGHMQKNSMFMAVEEVNARGGIHGKPLVLDVRDSSGRPGNARAIVDHFVVDKQYAVVMGGFSSRVSAALADKCEQRRIPLVVITGSDDAITLQDYRYVYRISPPRSRYPAAALDWARANYASARIALLSERSSYGDSMMRAVRQAAPAAGWEVAGEWRFEPGSRNMAGILAEAADAGPELLFLAAFPPEGARIIADLRRDLPDSILINLTPASTMTGSYALCGGACGGVLNPSLWLPGTDGAGSAYSDKYYTRFGSEPDYHGAQAYAAVIAVAQAMRKSVELGPESVRDTLATVSVLTPYGRVNFRQWDGFVNQNQPPNYLVRWNGRSFETVRAGN